MMNIHVSTIYNLYQERITSEEEKLVSKVLIDLQIDNSSLE